MLCFDKQKQCKIFLFRRFKTISALSQLFTHRCGHLPFTDRQERKQKLNWLFIENKVIQTEIGIHLISIFVYEFIIRKVWILSNDVTSFSRNLWKGFGVNILCSNTYIKDQTQLGPSKNSFYFILTRVNNTLKVGNQLT